MNYDVSLLAIESDTRGFIIGESLLDQDNVTDEAGAWEDIKADFTSLHVSRSTAVEKGVLFRPEASTLSLTTRATARASLFGRRIRASYSGTVLFYGRIKDVQVSTVLEDGTQTRRISLTAIDRIDELNNLVIEGWNRPHETTQARFEAWKTAVKPYFNETDNSTFYAPSYTYMPAMTEAESVGALEAFQRIADTQYVRVWTGAGDGSIHATSEPQTTPVVTFSDAPGATVSYTSLDLNENADHVLTGVSGTVAADNTYTATLRLPEAMVRHEESFEPDVWHMYANFYPDVALRTWLGNIPLRAYTALTPTGLTTEFVPSLMVLDPTDYVTVVNGATTYDSGIQSVEYSFTPEKALASVGLFPGHVVTRFVPSPPVNFRVTGRQTVPNQEIRLAWDPPDFPMGFDSYELRVAEGTPPTSTTGTLVSTFPVTTEEYIHGGLTVGTTYAYSLFAKVGTTYGDRATLIQTLII